tara:strand:- start:2381 stop:2575 length:195 start_codon:yes stop_codon:yes gene_type:complete
LIKYLEINIAEVAPIDDAKEIIMMARYRSNINPESNPSKSATGSDMVVRKIYPKKYRRIKVVGL